MSILCRKSSDNVQSSLGIVNKGDGSIFLKFKARKIEPSPLFFNLNFKGIFGVVFGIESVTKISLFLA